MTVVGEAYVAILPDTDRFRPELEGKVRLAAQRVKAKIEATVDASGLRREVSRAATAAEVGQEIDIPVNVGGGGGGDGFDDLARRAGDFGEAMTVASIGSRALRGALAVLGVRAAVDAFGAAAASVTALGGAAVATTSALTPLAGVLATIPAFATAAAQGIGVIAGAFQGVGDAVKEYLDAQKNAAKEAQTAGRAIAAAQRGQESAARRVADAVANAGRVQVRAAEAIADAEMALTDARERQISLVRDALERVTDAERNAERAVRESRDAQLSLNEARREATEDLEDLRLAAEGAALGEERANVRLAQAQRRFVELSRGRLTQRGLERGTAEELADAELAIREAELDVREAQERRLDVQQELNEAEQRGVDGAEKVVRAEQAVADAQERARRSTEDLADAERDAARARIDSARDVERAQRNLTRTTRESAQSIQDAERDVQRAFEDVADAASRLAEAGTDIDEFAEAMNRLSPAAQSFVRTLLTFEAPLRRIRDVAAAGLLPGLEQALRTVAPLFTTFEPVVTATALAVAAVAQSFADLVASPAFSADLLRLTTTNAEIIERMGEAASTLTGALLGIVVEAAPLTDFIVSLTERFADLTQRTVDAWRETGTLREFFEGARDTLEQFLRLVRDVGEGLVNIFRAAFPEGERYLAQLGQLAESFADITREARQSGALGNFFESLRPTTEALSGLFADIVGAFAQIAEAWLVHTPEIVAALRTELLPALVELFTEIKPDVILALITALTELVEIFTVLAQSPVLGLVIEGLTKVLSIVEFLVTDLGPLSDALVAAFVGLAALGTIGAAIDVAKFVSKFGGMARGIQLLRDSVNLLSGAISFLVANPIVLLLAALAAVLVWVLKNQEVFERFGAKLFDLGVVVAEFFGDLTSRMSEALVDLREWVGNVAKSLADGAIAFRDAAAKLGRAIIDGITDAIGGVGNIGQDIANAIIDLINRHVIQRINRALEFEIGIAGFNVPVNPPDISRIPNLANGAVVKALPGVGTLARIGEGTRPEAVIPLPPGLVEGLQAIAAGGGSPLVGEMTIVEAQRGRETAAETVTSLRALQFVNTGR